MIALACSTTVRRADHGLGLLVELIDPRGRVALQAGLLHVDLPLLVGRPLLRGRGEEPVGEPLGDVVGDLLPFEPAHVAGRAGGHGHVVGGELLRPGGEVHVGLLGVEQDAVLRLVVDLELGVVGPHVALAAGLGGRASSTEAACRAWQAVQVPIEPSLFGLPTSWHFWQPTLTATGPSIAVIDMAGRSTAPLWNSSEKATAPW